MLGQEKVRTHLKNLIARKEVPRTMVLTGPVGQGKSTVARWFIHNTGMNCIDVENLKVDDIRAMIESSFKLSFPTIYFLRNAHLMTYQAQNALLKMAEEPARYACILMTATEARKLLPTIISRSTVIQLEPYTQEQLEYYSSDAEIASVCQNPGEIERMKSINFKEFMELARKIVDNIAKISAANAFNILNHVEENDVDLLLPMLIKLYHERLRNGERVLEQLKVLQVYKGYFELKASNKKHLLEMAFIDLRRAESAAR